MLRSLAVGLSLLSVVEGSLAGPPSALPVRTASASTPNPQPAPSVAQVVQAEPAPVAVQAPVAAPAPAPALAPAPAQVQLQPAPVVMPAAPIPAVVHASPAPVAAQPYRCERAVRPGRVWLDSRRPVVVDDRFRYEPRIRDLRFAPQSSTLPGSGLGAPDLLPVLPPSYHPGYFRTFDTR